MNHCRKITASDVAKLGVQSKALVSNTPDYKNPNGVSVGSNSVVNHTGAANFSGDVGQARPLPEGIEDEFDG
jgi:hypothetical protein